MFAAWLSGFFYGQWSTISQPCLFHFLILAAIVSSLAEKKQRILIMLGFLNGFSMSYPWAQAGKSKCLAHIGGASIFQQQTTDVISFGKGEPKRFSTIFYSNAAYSAPRNYTNSARKKETHLITQWETALIQGDLSSLDPIIKKDFQNSGIIHLLCVSGFHIHMVFHFILIFIRKPLKFFKFLQPNPQYLEIIYRSAPWVGLTVIIIYSLSIGFPPSTQRATLVCITHHILRHTPKNHTTLPQVAATLQSLLFPYHMLSPSNLLSWGAYLIIRHSTHQNRFKEFLSQNFYLALLSLIFVDQFPIHAPVINFMILPFFPLIYLATIINMAIPNHMTQELILMFFHCVSLASQPIQTYPSLMITFSTLSVFMQNSLILLFFFTFIKTFLFSTK